jgi:tryptophan synthase alpha chain
MSMARNESWLTHRLRRLREKNEKALALFLTTGYPTLDATVPLVLELEKAGADIIELGMPFSDPVADGPVIQQSSEVALRNGVTLSHMFRMAEAIRASSTLPVVVMGYVNPILRYGLETFFLDAARAGIDGIILPEVPLEEAVRFEEMLHRTGLALIRLVAPTTPPERVTQIDALSSGFLYCVSSTGVTGGTNGTPVEEYLRRVRPLVRKNPMLVGFGIAGPEEARRYARYADGVVVGSALLKRLTTEPVDATMRWVRSLKEGMAHL